MYISSGIGMATCIENENGNNIFIAIISVKLKCET